MVATDTVVGIVGAVLLVGVMVGIYVYEFNQAEEAGIGTDGENGTGPFVAGAQEIISYDGSIGNSAGPAGRADDHVYEFNVTQQAASMTLNMTYASNTPAPLPPSPAFMLDLLDAEGEVIASGESVAPAAGGSDYLVTLDVPEGLAPGSYSIRVSDGTPGGVSPGGDFHVEGILVYA